MSLSIGEKLLQGVDEVCERIGGNSLKQTLWATTGLITTGIAQHTIVPLMSSSETVACVALLVNIFCIATLCKNAIQWRNVLIFLVGITVISAFGVRWSPKNPENLFKEREYKNLGKLEYEYDSNNTPHPTVTILTDDPYKKGVALGFLTAPQTIYVYTKVMAPLTTFAQIFSGDITGEWLDRNIKHYTIPAEYLIEMAGLCDGVNKWCRAKGNPFRLTLEEVKRVHCFTDTYKMGNVGLFNMDIIKYLWNTMFGDLGCSTVILKRENQMVIGRNLDWPGIGMGKYGFIRRDHLRDGQTIQSHIYPGLIAVGTAIKINNGMIRFATIVNECPIRSMERGIPCGLWVRRCIENCSSVKEVKKFISQTEPVASSFHLIVADGVNARNYQMHPREDEYFIERNFCNLGNLIVTNHFLEPDTNKILDDIPPAGTSRSRFVDISTRLLESSTSVDQIVNEVRDSILLVNRPYTLSAQIYQFGPVDDGVIIAVSDAWAGLKL